LFSFFYVFAPGGLVFGLLILFVLMTVKDLKSYRTLNDFFIVEQ